MANRFGKRRGAGQWLKSILLPSGFSLLIMGMLYVGLGSVDEAARAEQLRSAEQAIRRAAVHCYAVEGQYPPNLAYLQEHYGTQIDSQRYIVHYQPIGANLMPDIIVIPLDKQAKSLPNPEVD